MGRKVVMALLVSLVAVNFASAGIVRHVVKPVVRTAARGSAHVVVKTAKVVKAIAY